MVSFAIFATGVFAFECARNSFTSAWCKHAITDLTLSGTSTVAALRSVSFIYNDDASSTVRYGFIAEDTAAVDSNFATYDAQRQSQRC